MQLTAVDQTQLETNSFTVDCSGRTYDNQVAHCASQGMHIASVHNNADNDAILSLLQSQGCHAYIGAQSNGAGTWSWRDGTPWDYVSPLNDAALDRPAQTPCIFRNDAVARGEELAQMSQQHGP